MRMKKGKKDDVSIGKMEQKTEDVIFQLWKLLEWIFLSRTKERCAPPFKPSPETVTIVHVQDKARQVSVENQEGYYCTISSMCSSARLPATKLLVWLATAGSMWAMTSCQCTGRETDPRAALSWSAPQTGVFSPNRFQSMGRDTVENFIFIGDNKSIIT